MKKLVPILFAMAPLAGHAAQLFYLEPSEGQCAAKTVEVPSCSGASPTTLFSAKECPTFIVWDTPSKSIYYVASQRVWKRPMQGVNATATDLGAFPATYGNFWIDSKSGKARMAYAVDLEDSDAVGNQYKFEGKSYAAQGLPDWGIPSMAIAAELDGKTWKRLEVAPTRTQAGDVPGLSVLKTLGEKTERGMSLSALLAKSTCGSALDCRGEDKSAKKLFKGSDDFSVIKTTSGNLFAFATVFGDTNHASSPVYFCKNSCAIGTKLKEVKEKQLGIALEGDLLLVATEYENANPRVYDAKTGALILQLPKVRSAIWLPNL